MYKYQNIAKGKITNGIACHKYFRSLCWMPNISLNISYENHFYHKTEKFSL